MNDSARSNKAQLRAQLREKFQRERNQLLPALHYLQDEFGFMPEWAMEIVSWHLGIPASEVYGAATSYSELSFEEKGEHVIRVCTGLSCRVAGADAVLEGLMNRLGVKTGETAQVGNTTVTLEHTACGFLCGVAPAMRLDGKWHGRSSVNSAVSNVDRLLRKGAS